MDNNKIVSKKSYYDLLQLITSILNLSLQEIRQQFADYPCRLYLPQPDLCIDEIKLVINSIKYIIRDGIKNLIFLIMIFIRIIHYKSQRFHIVLYLGFCCLSFSLSICFLLQPSAGSTSPAVVLHLLTISAVSSRIRLIGEYFLSILYEIH